MNMNIGDRVSVVEGGRAGYILLLRENGTALVNFPADSTYYEREEWLTVSRLYRLN